MKSKPEPQLRGDGPKRALANLETMRKVFTVPEGEDSTLGRLERMISQNLFEFLREHVVAGDIEPSDLEQAFRDTRLPEDPQFVSEQVDFLLQHVVAHSVHTAAPGFIGHMTSALPYFMFPLAKIMTTLNQNVVKIETSKAFTPMERQVVGILHRLVYDRDDQFYERFTQSSTHSLGVFTSGGTIANITGLWAARNRRLGPIGPGGAGSIDEEGLAGALKARDLDGLAVLVSRRGHYSLRKAVDVLGLGRRNLVAIPVGSGHKIDLKALVAELRALKARRVAPLAIVGVAGTTETGSVDPLRDLADIAAEWGAHFHVDAAWGGPTLFSERYRHLLAGIDRADSVTIDAHKQLYVPVGAGIALFRDEAALSAVEHHANYIIRVGSRDIGKHTLEGTRPGTALLVHAGLYIIGKRGYELLVDLGIGKAGQFAKMIKSHPDFELVTEPELNLLTYRYVPEAARRVLVQADSAPELRQAVNELVSQLTESIQKEQRQRGVSFVSRTRLEGFAHGGQVLSVFRVVLANPLTTRQILADILDEQRGYGERLWTEEGLAAKLAELVPT